MKIGQRLFATLFAYLLSLSGAFAASPAPSAPSVVDFGPKGMMRDVRQIHMYFDSDMVALGDNRAGDAATVQCTGTDEHPKGHWITGSRWVAEFEHGVNDGVECRITPKAIKGLDGRPATVPAKWSFNTGGPRVKIFLSGMASTGSALEDSAAAFLASATVDETSLRHLSCMINGASTPVHILKGDERSKEFAVLWRQYHGWDKAPDDTSLWIVARCGTHSLPNDAEVYWTWGKDIKTPNGLGNRDNQIFKIEVRPVFSAELKCQTMFGVQGCDPRFPITAHFTNSVNFDEAKKLSIKRSTGEKYRIDPPQNPYPRSEWNITGPFKEGEYLKPILTGEIRDVEGRHLKRRQKALHPIRIAHLPPYVGMVREQGIMNWLPGETAWWPVATRSAGRSVQADLWQFDSESASTPALLALHEFAEYGPDQGTGISVDWSKAFAVSRAVLKQLPGKAPRAIEKTIHPETPGMAFSGIPLSGYGTWLIEADSPAFRGNISFPTKNGKVALSVREDAENALVRSRVSVVQVTNIDISARLSSHGSSLIWLTALDSGKPIAGATAEIWSCERKLLFKGEADAEGRVSFAHLDSPTCAFKNNRKLWIVARYGKDVSVLPVRSDGGFSSRYAHEPKMLVHTILDRTLFKAGETVSMQHLLRIPSIDGWALPSAGSKGKLRIFYNWNEPVAEQEIQWHADGSADSHWEIPSNAKLGRYRFQVDDDHGGVLHSGEFQVEEFRVPAFNASLTGETSWQTASQTVRMQAGLSFLAGGPAAGETVLIRGEYKEGVHPPVNGYTFRDEEQGEFSAPAFAEQQVKLDKGGKWESVFPAPQLDRSATLFAEMRFQDANGEFQTQSASIPIWPGKMKVGLQVMKSVKPGFIDISAVALDEKDQPVSGDRITIDVADAETRWDQQRWHAIAASGRDEICAVITDDKGKAHCEVPWKRKTTHAGWVFRARAKDAQPVSQFINPAVLAWSRGAEAIEHAGAPVKAGETEHLHVHAPFLPATLLLTVEREGVLDSQVYSVTREDEEIDLPTRSNYAPAVQVVGRFVEMPPENRGGAYRDRPQVKESSMTLAFDPASNRLGIRIQPESATVKPGSILKTRLEVSRKVDGKPVPRARITIVAVDEGLLALKGNPTWAALDAYWQPRFVDTHGVEFPLALFQVPVLGSRTGYVPSLEEAMLNGETPVVSTMAAAPAPSAALNQTVMTTAIRPALQQSLNVKRRAVTNVEAASGMEAGEADARSNFSSLALWKTDIIADAHGQATIDIPMPDSLTQWRIVAIATDGADFFGTDETKVQTVLPIQIVPGLPQTVRSGDTLNQSLTVRNTDSKARTVRVRANATPEIASGAFFANQRSPENELAGRGLGFEKTVHLEAGENRTIEWPVSVPDGVAQLAWKIRAQTTGWSEHDSDAVEFLQKVVPAVPISVRESTLLHVDEPRSLAVVKPSGKVFDAGISVRWQASLVDAAITGAQDWMRNYPYSCLEQRTSRAAVSGDAAQWQEVMSSLPRYLDDRGLARYFPSPRLRGSEMLTTYLLDIADAYRLTIPATEKARMQQALREALTHEGVNDWMPKDAAPAPRLAMQAALQGRLGSVKPVVPKDLNELPTISLLDWVRYVLTTPDTPERKDRLEEAAAQLRNRFDIQGTRLTWRNDGADHWWWLMWGDDVATARTVLLVQQWLGEDPRWKDDIPLLAASLVDKQQQGHWSTTVGNAWSVAALRRFAAASETQAVTGELSASFAGDKQVVAWQQSDELKWRWPAQEPRATLELSHRGSGAPWATVRVLAAVREDAPIAHGVTVRRSIVPVEQRVAGKWSQGDVMKVTLDMTSESDLGWVVVNDPIPSGATILGKGLGRESQLAKEKAAPNWWWRPSYAEMASDGYRGYYARVWRGHWQAEYLVRLNNAGSFDFPPTRIEAMYAPEIFGEAPNEKLEVAP